MGKKQSACSSELQFILACDWNYLWPWEEELAVAAVVEGVGVPVP
jgi:hypothetical protein